MVPGLNMTRIRQQPLAPLPNALLSFQLSILGRKLFTIITFDPDRVEKLSWQGEGQSLAWIIWRGLAIRKAKSVSGCTLV
jgi:hypothetical protein